MKLRCGICALLCLALIAGDALGQGGGGRRGGGGAQPQRGGGGLIALAKAKDVAAELKISEDQTKKLDDLEKSSREKITKAREEAGDDREAMMQKTREIGEETNKQLGSILSADQMKRLKQLQLQSSIKNGGLMMALANPDTQKAINLNDEQKEQLRGFMQDSGEQMREIFQSTQDQEERQKKMAEYRESMGKKVEKLLTDEQKAKLKEAQGEPFKGEFPRPAFGGGRRKDKDR
jgi:periplasmic protein CpxP/Spy